MPLLGICALAVAVQNYRFFSGSADLASAVVNALTDEFNDGFDDSADPLLEPLDALQPEQVADYLRGLQTRTSRNPFLTRNEADRVAGISQPGIADSEREGGLPVLRGTLWSEGRRVAWIGGSARAEGERIDGMLLERIEQGRVTLLRGHERFLVGVTPAAAAPVATQESAKDEGVEP